MVAAHSGKWLWLPYEYDGNDVWLQPHFVKELRIVLENGDPRVMLDSLKSKPGTTKREREETISKLGLKEDEIVVFDLLSELIYLKEYRNGVRCKANYLSEPFLLEARNRTGCPLPVMRYLFPFEMKAFLDGAISVQTLQKRMEFSCYYVPVGRPPVAAVGNEAKRLFGHLIQREEVEQTTELLGMCANPGRVKGVARLLLDAKELDRVKKGDIIVTRMTTPDFVPAMKRAAAIVTDDGGITCHAAIVSRELGVPCVVGTRKATKVIREGDIIEVHAHEGLVRRLAAPQA